MQTLEAIKIRRSVREFNSAEIPKKLLEQIIDCARLAPTARNEQPWEFIVVTDRETLKKLAQITDHGKFIQSSSCCIVVVCHDTKYYLEDGCAATENILLAATDLGLASCWVAGDKKPYCEDIKKILAVPQQYKVVSLVALGYANGPLTSPEKKPLRELLHWQKW